MSPFISHLGVQMRNSESVLQGMYMITLEDKNYSQLVIEQHGLQIKCVCCTKRAANSPVFLENHLLQVGIALVLTPAPCTRLAQLPPRRWMVELLYHLMGQNTYYIRCR